MAEIAVFNKEGPTLIKTIWHMTTQKHHSSKLIHVCKRDCYSVQNGAV